jgi:hypothetical protein
MTKSTSTELTLSKIFRKFGLLTGTLENEGVTLVDWQKPIDNTTARRNLAAYLKMGCPKVNENGEIINPTLPNGEDLARLILGDDYLSPEDVAKAYGWSYQSEQLANFTNMLPDFEELMWLRSNGYMLTATPPTDTNLLQVRDLDNQLFYSKSEGWYAESKHTFSREDVVKAGQWLAIRKEPYPDSRNKTWADQEALLAKNERVPNAPEVSYAVTAYYKVRGVYLLSGVYVRTSSVDAGGHRVSVGYFDSAGLSVDRCWDDLRDFDLGLSSARE